MEKMLITMCSKTHPMDYVLIELNAIYILPPTFYYFRFILFLSFYVGL